MYFRILSGWYDKNKDEIIPCKILAVRLERTDITVKGATPMTRGDVSYAGIVEDNIFYPKQVMAHWTDCPWVISREVMGEEYIPPIPLMLRCSVGAFGAMPQLKWSRWASKIDGNIHFTAHYNENKDEYYISGANISFTVKEGEEKRSGG